jgi:DNA-binding CsgD family transcriptional regulator
MSLQYAVELLDSIADLHLGNIDFSAWLQRLAGLAECEAACAISWTAGKPETAEFAYSTDPIQLDKTWLSWVDNLVHQTQPTQPILLSELAKQAGLFNNPGNDLLANNKLMIGFLDADPAITLLVFRTDNRPDGWNDDDRQRLATLLPSLLKAHCVHKKLTLGENRLAMANSALNGLPRVLISLTPTGEIIRPNSAGAELLQGEVFSAKDGRLSICDRKVMQQFMEKLAEIRILGKMSVDNFIWNRSFRCAHDNLNYQLMLRAHIMKGWRIESSPYDRFVVLYIACIDSTASPTAEQLRDYYDLSNAQARVVLALFEGNDVMTAAAKLHISINTIRSHVRAIYAKLGVSSQSELLRILTRTLVEFIKK